MKKILVSSDLTVKSDVAINAAKLLATAFKSEIKIIHIHKGENVTSASALFPGYENKIKEMKDLYRNGLEKRLLKQIESFQEGLIKFSGKVLFTLDMDNFDEITDVFTSDLVVIPNLNEEFDSFIGGALSERLIRVSDQDVLIAKKDFTNNINKILVPFAINEFSVEAIAKAKTLALAFKSKITLVHLHDIEGLMELEELDVHSEQETVLNNLKIAIDELVSLNLLDELILEYCSFGKKEELLNIISGENPDLLVMGASRKKGLERLYLGSYCEYILRNATTNLLITKI